MMFTEFLLDSHFQYLVGWWVGRVERVDADLAFLMFNVVCDSHVHF